MEMYLVIVVLLGVIIVQNVTMVIQKKEDKAERKNLLNRILSNDVQEYREMEEIDHKSPKKEVKQSKKGSFLKPEDEHFLR